MNEHVAAAGTLRRRPGAAAVLGVSTVAVGLGSSIGFVIGLLSPLLRDDLGISRGRVGLLVGVYFGCTGLGSLRAGILVDERGPRRMVALDLAIVGAGAAVAALSGTYAVLLAVCVVAGAGYALSAAGTNVAVAAVVPESGRARALSLKTAGVPMQFAVGSLLAPASSCSPARNRCSPGPCPTCATSSRSR